MLASKRCFPMQSKTGNTSPQEQIRESLQIHSALDIFLQLSCTAMHSISLWKVLNRSIFRLQKHLSLPITSLLNKNYIALSPALDEYEYLLLLRPEQTGQTTISSMSTHSAVSNSSSMAFLCTKRVNGTSLTKALNLSKY